MRLIDLLKDIDLSHLSFDVKSGFVDCNRRLYIVGITSVKDVDDFYKEIFKDDECICRIQNWEFDLMIGKNKKMAVIPNYDESLKTTIFDYKDIDEDDSYLILKYGRILLKETDS